MLRRSILCGLLFCVLVCRGFEEISLEGADWSVTSRNGSISVPGKVPGTAHVALMNAGIITGDPYYRFNEVAYSWVAEDDWTFSKTFKIDAESRMTDGDQVVMLEFESVDTVGSVHLNGVQLELSSVDGQEPHASVSNMHVPLRFIVSTPGNGNRILKFGEDENLLEVKLRNPRNYAKAQAEGYPYPVPMTHFYNVWDDNYTSPFGGNRSSHFNFVRKTASDFGWDWGPAYVPQGIMGRVSLVTFAVGYCMPTFTVMQNHLSTGAVSIDVTTEVFLPEEHSEKGAREGGAGKMQVTITKSAPPGTVGEEELVPVAFMEVPVNSLVVGANPILVSLEVTKEDVELWWPNGYGAQPLYMVEVSYEDPSEQTQTHTRKIGLRRAVLRTDPISAQNMFGKTGNAFYFEINGVAIYAKGANWIPADVFSDRVDDERMEWLLQSAVDANMNMVRVWGGGFYQPDKFYDLADAKGLMIWQEMMFACALYPTDDAFLASVRAEVKYQVGRLQHHASLVIFGGNNENESALTWYKASRQHKDFYKADYLKLYIQTVYAAVKEADPMVGRGRAWVDSSPSNGVLSEEPYVKRWKNANLWEYGDVHFYDYGHDCENYHRYPLPRFVSEHGFMSWPAFTLLEDLTAPEDWSRESAFFQYRMRHPNGNKEILKMMLRHYHIPAANASAPRAPPEGPWDPPRNPPTGSPQEAPPLQVTPHSSQRTLFDAYLFLSQVQQARCYETSISLWRRLKSTPSVRTMGVLYWQLNDIWPGPSWSSMEYDGRWRVTHYSVQRMYAPLLLSSYKGPKGFVRTHITSDQMEAVQGSLAIYLHAWGAADDRPIRAWHQTVTVPALTSVEVAARPESQYLSGHRIAADSPESTATSLRGLEGPFAKGNSSPKSYFLRMVFSPDPSNATADAASTAGAEVEGFHFFTTLGAAALPKARVSVDAVELQEGGGRSQATVTVSADRTAVYVTLETKSAALAGKFSENAFLLLPGQSKTVTFTCRRAIASLAALKEALQVRSLRDTYV
mmetsp:Transcript_29005/g.63450  ORF Transcript_29005/g.63450 Transcript_29005/m.63450 type:complete len:1018 (-) Transcript_29005:480-3533(-)|eukprot:CAMPEP_0118948716 /NCGR_PEP_ID=MMETSP1169-20130426/48292_1 /TAXON_ID=36882 /ORGANISM="Pyramimonas obovata, Strain CCMP722" /LENGTH=1017 /DNA_ID=CAMNT_0006895213 /DNA_START=84 /DNA_END=3137 /DNA_ORIENTATION=-